MTIRHALIALIALTLPATALAQWNGNWPVPGPVPPPAPPRAPVAEPWMARPMPAPTTQGWRAPSAQPNRSPALEPIDLPPAIEQGVDMLHDQLDILAQEPLQEMRNFSHDIRKLQNLRPKRLLA